MADIEKLESTPATPDPQRVEGYELTRHGNSSAKTVHVLVGGESIPTTHEAVVHQYGHLTPEEFKAKFGGDMSEQQKAQYQKEYDERYNRKPAEDQGPTGQSKSKPNQSGKTPEKKNGEVKKGPAIFHMQDADIKGEVYGKVPGRETLLFRSDKGVEWKANPAKIEYIDKAEDGEPLVFDFTQGDPKNVAYLKRGDHEYQVRVGKRVGFDQQSGKPLFEIEGLGHDLHYEPRTLNGLRFEDPNDRDELLGRKRGSWHNDETHDLRGGGKKSSGGKNKQNGGEKKRGGERRNWSREQIEDFIRMQEDVEKRLKLGLRENTVFDRGDPRTKDLLEDQIRQNVVDSYMAKLPDNQKNDKELRGRILAALKQDLEKLNNERDRLREKEVLFNGYEKGPDGQQLRYKVRVTGGKVEKNYSVDDNWNVLSESSWMEVDEPLNGHLSRSATAENSKIDLDALQSSRKKIEELFVQLSEALAAGDLEKAKEIQAQMSEEAEKMKSAMEASSEMQDTRVQEITTQQAKEVADKRKRSGWRKVYDWLRHPIINAQNSAYNRANPDEPAEGAPVGPGVPVAARETSTTRETLDKERRSRAGFWAGVGAVGGAVLTYFLVGRAGYPHEIAQELINNGILIDHSKNVHDLVNGSHDHVSFLKHNLGGHHHHAPVIGFEHGHGAHLDSDERYPWNWAEDQVGAVRAENWLHELGRRAAEHGHSVEWHHGGIVDGRQTEWISIDGNSHTQYVVDVLNRFRNG